MKSLLTKSEFIKRFDVIGFDMDGTLYEEELFIKQVYFEISKYIQVVSDYGSYLEIYSWLLERWTDKGSSYPFIFSEALLRFKGISSEKNVSDCLYIYRNFKPHLSLEASVSKYLNLLRDYNKEIFLISDGSSKLQRKKFHSLNLGTWFKEENVVFTGDLGKESYKPNIKGIDSISCLKNNNTGTVLYFGDRDIDEDFALNAKFCFVKVGNFYNFWGDLGVN